MTPLVPIKGECKLLDELEKQRVFLVKYQDCIVQAAPPAGSDIEVLCPNSVSQLGETLQDYDIQVDVSASKLVQQNKSKQIGEVLSQRDLTRIHIPFLQTVKP
ncbi:hypothetical protein V8G54_032276 [Vigna mungo]|uniref:Uncharacterized protein n=1 Tax=Vigna mungo TaxID=3915 RepID=A0AAQ3MLW0_VIGMU